MLPLIPALSRYALKSVSGWGLLYCTSKSEDACPCRDLIELTVPELNKMAKFVNLTTDQIINYDENVKPKEIIIEDKSTLEQMELIQ